MPEYMQSLIQRKIIKGSTNFGLVLILIFATISAKSQEVGVSASFFAPKNGYLSTPISPISFRGLGYDITDYVAIETGITLYRMSGLNIIDLPFESKKPLIGPTFTFFVPLEIVLEFGSNKNVFKLKGGGFVFYGFDQKINYGNLDRALIDYTGLEVLNSDFKFKNTLGNGFHFGGEYIHYLNKKFGVSLGAYYLMGSAPIDLEGSYTGGSSNVPVSTTAVTFNNAKIDFTGIEVSVGLLFSNY